MDIARLFLERCWYDFENGHTCMLPSEHAGPHEPTSDNDIISGFVELSQDEG